jgi:hypothetical protein
MDGKQQGRLAGKAEMEGRPNLEAFDGVEHGVKPEVLQDGPIHLVYQWIGRDGGREGGREMRGKGRRGR